MALPERESPVGKRVSLFVTCIVDMIYPETGMSAVDILEHIGVEVDFPLAQTCCGQPAFNSGYRDEARTVARHFFKAFKDAEVIVTPSGSCATMVRHEYPHLFTRADGTLYEQARRMAAITWEFSEFLVEGLGIADLQLQLPEKESFAMHDACHGLRGLGLGRAARELIANLGNAELLELNECEVCCGFGGLFSVKMADISNAMLKNKVDNINDSAADTIVTGDVSCLTQMNGGLSRSKSRKRVLHLADVLAKGLGGGRA
ncbi:MAG: (Fe-S)-binding protein [Chloroflexota bacterium]|nr:(Fe-S)-binding protein [Chloroflexota bacterium]